MAEREGWKALMIISKQRRSRSSEYTPTLQRDNIELIMKKYERLLVGANQISTDNIAPGVELKDNFR